MSGQCSVDRGEFQPSSGRLDNPANRRKARTTLDELAQSSITITIDHLIFLCGIAVFATWLLGTGLGRRALLDAPPRRNRMLPQTPFIPFFVWFVGVSGMQWGIEQLIGTLGGWQGRFLEHAIYGFGALLTSIIILIIARFSFARGLRGFGLRLKTIPKDVVLAVVTLLAIWPLVMAMIHVTLEVTKAIYGPDFEMPRHPQLELMTESAVVPLQILIAVLAVVAAPLVEELLFRGMFQTVIRSYLQRPWLAIFMTSAMFASVHLNRTHWPALFVLGIGLGYAYEKSGSLWRPIFMHAMFNGVTIAVALIDQSAGGVS